MVSYFLSKYIWGSGEQKRQRTALSALCDEMGLNLVKARGLRPDRVIGAVGVSLEKRRQGQPEIP